MTPEDALAAAAVHAWKTHVDRAAKLFSPLTDSQLREPVAPGRNRLIYLWGHLIGVHDGILPLVGIGERLHPEYDAVFVAEPDGPAVEAFPASQLRQAWDEVHDALLAGFTRFTAAQWTARHNAVSEADFAVNPLRHRLAVLLNRTNHLAYHLGQVALARI
jgi:hypothetical protein